MSGAPPSPLLASVLPRGHIARAPLRAPESCPAGQLQELELGTKHYEPFSGSQASDEGEKRGAGPCLRNHGLGSETRPSPEPSRAELGALGPGESLGKGVSAAAVVKVLGSAGS